MPSHFTTTHTPTTATPVNRPDEHSPPSTPHPALGPYHDGREMALGIVLAGLAGAMGAAAWLHTDGWYVTFMTGNTERMILEHAKGEHVLGISALTTVLVFILGVMVATWARIRWWRKSRHGATVLTTGAAYLAWFADVATEGASDLFGVIPVLCLAFGLGALNTSVSRNNQVAMPLSYVTGTLVKMGQGFALHMARVSRWVWVSQAVTYAGFLGGILTGAVLFVPAGTDDTLAVLAILCTLITLATWRLDHPLYAVKDAGKA